jgi:hypothetical protein
LHHLNGKAQAHRCLALDCPRRKPKSRQGESTPLQAVPVSQTDLDPPSLAQNSAAPESVVAPDPCVQTQQARLQSAILLLLGLGLFCALPFVLSIGSVVFLPPVTAIVLTIVLAPAADRLVRLGLPNMLASFLALLLLIAVVVVALSLILQPAYDMVDQVPAMARRVTLRFAELRSNLAWMNDINRQIARMTGTATMREVVVATPSVIEQVAFATPSVLIEVLLTFLLTFFMIDRASAPSGGCCSTGTALARRCASPG